MILGVLVIVAIGLFTFSGGYCAWPWFMNNRKARFAATVLGPTGARIFYMMLGAGIVVLGIVAAFQPG